MNPLEKMILAKATLHAQNLLKIASENEPEITAILAEIAPKVSAEMVGLEYKFKAEKSLAKKISEKIATDMEDLLKIQ